MNKWKMQKEIRNAKIEQREFLKNKEVTLMVNKREKEFCYDLFHKGSIYFSTKDKDKMLDYIYFLGLKVKNIEHINYNLLENDLAF